MNLYKSANWLSTLKIVFRRLTVRNVSQAVHASSPHRIRFIYKRLIYVILPPPWSSSSLSLQNSLHLSPMDDEQVLDLFDVYWFYHNKTANPPSPHLSPPSSPPSIPPKSDPCSEEPTFSRLKTLHRRSHSDQSLSVSVSPNSVLPTSPKLDTIFSGKQTAEFTEKRAEPEVAIPSKKAAGLGRERQQKKKKMSKSLSDLEFEELKGFMDLGFTFPEAEVDSRLMSIVPGLQRWGKNSGKGETAIHERAVVSRPYLSEAWLVETKEADPLANWKISAGVDGADLKNQLRSWAQAVASTVR